MPYLSSLIHHGEGVLFTSLVEPPTVTLPRIKAITMGTIPNYADMISNVLEKDTSGFNEESIVGRASSSNLRIVFYGDDTWLRLFPNLFSRSEGTSSFYVSDFTEVDNNVTRHIDKELMKDDWDIMILHYLGLDHIGHIHGPYSHLVPQKLTEMDLIIQKLHHGLKKWGPSTLLVVCGDHGMKDTGGHGGATHAEIHVPLVFISQMLSQLQCCPRKPYSEDKELINQRDLAPTLSALLGLPPPSGNLGRALPSILRCFLRDPAALLYALHANAWQVAGLFNSPVASKTDGHFLYEESSRLHANWITSGEVGKDRMITCKDQEFLSQPTERIIQLYSGSVSEMTSKFVETLIKFDYYAMFLGGLITWQAFLTLFVRGVSSRKGSCPKQVLMLTITLLAVHVIFCTTITCSNSSLCKQDVFTFMFITFIVIIMSFNVFQILHGAIFFPTYAVKEKWKEIVQSPLHFVLVGGGFLHAVSLTSSSFIEEEHQTWQFLYISLIILQGLLTHRDLHVEKRKESRRNTSYSLSSDIATYQDKGLHKLNEMPERCHEVQQQYLFSNKPEHFQNLTKTDKCKFPFAFISLLFAVRVLRDWNRTGDKWGNLPDIADWISQPQNVVARSVVMAFSLVGLILLLRKQGATNSNFRSTLFIFLSASCIFAYRASIGDVILFLTYPSSRGTMEFKLFLCILVLLLGNGCLKAHQILTRVNTAEFYDDSNVSMKKIKVAGNEMVKVNALEVFMEYVATVWILFCTILKRPCDVPVVLIYMLGCVIMTDSSEKIAKSNHSPAFASLLSFSYIWLGMVFYFYQGNSNSLASIDLQAGYVGQENYNPIIVGLLLFCHTFSMPIASLLLLSHSLLKATMRDFHFDAGSIKESLRAAGKSIAFARMLPVVIYLPLVVIQRHHLFIWTVFSPKLIYETTLMMATLLGLAFLSILEFIVSLDKIK